MRAEELRHDDHEHHDTMSRRRRSRGQALVEFALVLPVFLILLFGIIDIARLVFLASALNNGAREGARFAAVAVRPAVCTDPNPDLDRLQCAEEVAIENSWGQASSTMTVVVYCQEFEADGSLTPTPPSSIAASACGANDLLTVHTQAPFSLVTPLVGQFIGTFTVAGEASVTVNS
jgi:Flp pilus assembly protein TadG